ncbi:MAG: hypothetical protein GX616_16335 [Planctomycetes bacterium]|nr:hypothetical protein [Planctomycetota bacterium]
MRLDLLKQTMTTLRERFSELQDRGRLKAELVESPILVRQPGMRPRKPPGSRGESVWIWSTTYRLPLVRQDVNGNPVVAEEALVDVDGNPWLDEAGRPIDYADCGAVRVVSLYGDAEVWPTFERLAADAGHLLSNSPSLIRDHFAPETPAMQPEPLRWICAVFDLAWARVPGSALRPETDKVVRVTIDMNLADPDPPEDDDNADSTDDTEPESTQEPPSSEDATGETLTNRRRRTEPFEYMPRVRYIPLDDLPRYLDAFPHPDALGGFTDPPEWLSTLDDVIQASVHALDILLDAMAADKKVPSLRTTGAAVLPNPEDTSTGSQSEGAVGGKQNPPPPPDQDYSGLTRTVRNAYFSYIHAERQAGKSLTDKAAYVWLKEHGSDSRDGADELADYELPSMETWARYVREARKILKEQKNQPRHARPHGGSIVPPDQI